MRTVLVLGGGGVKGLTHAGAWRAIQEAGIEVSEIIGTSIGALVGACIAGGQSYEELAKSALALKKPDIVLLNRWTLLLNGIRQPAVFQSDALQTYIESVLPTNRWDDLGLPLSVNAVDLESGETVWFGNDGRVDTTIGEAVYASCALPLFYPPAQIGDSYFVDGGVIDPLPIERAAEHGAELIIAVDAGAGKVRDSLDTVQKGMVAIHHRVMEIVGWEHKREMIANWKGPKLVYIRPQLDGYSTFDFAQTAYFLEEGYRATQEALQRVA
jgi:NTE family protein